MYFKYSDYNIFTVGTVSTISDHLAKGFFILDLAELPFLVLLDEYFPPYSPFSRFTGCRLIQIISRYNFWYISIYKLFYMTTIYAKFDWIPYSSENSKISRIQNRKILVG